MIDLDLNSYTKLYYTIGEVADIFNVNTSLIRFWEKELGFESSKKNAKGNRLYTPKDLQNFNKIYQLIKVEGFTLEGAKKSLKTKKKESKSINSDCNPNKESLITKLEEIKFKLIELKKK